MFSKGGRRAKLTASSHAGRYLRFDRVQLWRGTRESFLDLHPAGAVGNSEVRGVCGPYQVGMVNLHAVLWKGTPESLVDLHTVLGTNFASSYAEGVWTDGTIVRICGAAQAPWWMNLGTGHAIVWMITPPKLEAVSTTEGLNLSWSSADTEFVLERTTVFDSGSWELFSPTPTLKDGRWVMTVPLTNSCGFFRLRKR